MYIVSKQHKSLAWSSSMPLQWTLALIINNQLKLIALFYLRSCYLTYKGTSYVLCVKLFWAVARFFHDHCVPAYQYEKRAPTIYIWCWHQRKNVNHQLYIPRSVTTVGLLELEVEWISSLSEENFLLCLMPLPYWKRLRDWCPISFG